MENSGQISGYCLQLEKLKSIIYTANEKIICESPDKFIYENANFLTKSFLVIMCAYLESYIKDVLMVAINEINIRLDSTKLPHNLIKWALNQEKEFKDTELKFENLKISITKKKLDDFISGNPFRTNNLFKKFGIQLDKNETFNAQKEKISSIILKRNSVIHHNDEASDVSNEDLIENIEFMKKYIINIDKIVCNHLQC
ncbi:MULTISPECIES: HEPN domain-containing protein [unclassified Chitinophaga]|uniref:HEPN domain-containing protein n=1 Tax=unclassified Chitinophaga TaxID=2619133 RepID=UPI00300FFB5D